MKSEAHKSEDEEQLKEADTEIREQLAKKQAHRSYWRDEKLLKCATFFFANDGECSKERSHVEQQNRCEPGEKEIGRARIGIEEQFGAHVHSERGVGGEYAAKRFIETDGRCYVYSLA